MRTAFLVFFYFVGLAIGILLNIALIWVLCWALNAIGISHIGPVSTTFSWPLAIGLTVILVLIRGVFKVNIRKGGD